MGESRAHLHVQYIYGQLNDLPSSIVLPACMKPRLRSPSDDDEEEECVGIVTGAPSRGIVVYHEAMPTLCARRKRWTSG
jgi:hypothetical protein